MLHIPCPWCGPRDETEFAYGGEAHVDRPTADSCSDGAWAAYLFDHANPRGPLAERWVHVHGCRRWFHAVRDTLSHRILATYRVDEPRPRTPQ
jgi:heterotetrameric sarcosine oxidase delta subunit